MRRAAACLLMLSMLGCASVQVTQLADRSCRVSAVSIGRVVDAKCTREGVQVEHKAMSGTLAGAIAAVAGYFAGVLGLP